jgi:hypothetical protein
MMQRMSALILVGFISVNMVACGGGERTTEDTRAVQESPPGTIPVPGAASPGSAPDPHPAATAPDAAYPGTVEPHPVGHDTVARPGQRM